MQLDDGTHTWITVMPIDQLDAYGVQLAAGDAFVGFLRNLILDADAIEDHMRPLREAAWERANV